MKYALVAALLGVLGFIAPASAASSHQAQMQFNILRSQDRAIDRSSVQIVRTLDGKAVASVYRRAPKDEKWFVLKNERGVIAYSTSPGGSPLVPDVTSMMVADITGQGTGGMRYDNTTGGLEVSVVSGSISVALPFAGNADGQAGTASGQGVGLFAWNGTGWDRVTDDGSGNLNVNVNAISGSVAINPTQNTEYDSGVCFQAVSSDPVCGTGPATAHGCAAGPVLPCYWDVSKSQGFNASLVGHTVYGIGFHSGKSMLTLNVQLTCVDNSSFAFLNTLIFGDMTTGASLGAEQYIPIGGNAGRKIVVGMFCELFAISGTTVLSATDKPQVYFDIR